MKLLDGTKYRATGSIQKINKYTNNWETGQLQWMNTHRGGRGGNVVLFACLATGGSVWSWNSICETPEGFLQIGKILSSSSVRQAVIRKKEKGSILDDVSL